MLHLITVTCIIINVAEICLPVYIILADTLANHWVKYHIDKLEEITLDLVLLMLVIFLYPTWIKAVGLIMRNGVWGCKQINQLRRKSRNRKFKAIPMPWRKTCRSVVAVGKYHTCYVHKDSLIPRTLPAFSVQQLKNWEWPGDNF